MHIIAIVDDDRALRDALARLLVSCGYTVVRFSSAEDFLAYEESVDCLVLDVQLPGLSGLQLVDRLRMLDRPVPVVFITGHPDSRVHEAVRHMEMPWLQKPFDEDGLLEAISRATVMSLDSPRDDASSSRVRSVEFRGAAAASRRASGSADFDVV